MENKTDVDPLTLNHHSQKGRAPKSPGSVSLPTPPFSKLMIWWYKKNIIKT
jgi:hypothetical protein